MTTQPCHSHEPTKPDFIFPDEALNDPLQLLDFAVQELLLEDTVDAIADAVQAAKDVVTAAKAETELLAMVSYGLLFVNAVAVAVAAVFAAVAAAGSGWKHQKEKDSPISGWNRP